MNDKIMYFLAASVVVLFALLEATFKIVGFVFTIALYFLSFLTLGLIAGAVIDVATHDHHHHQY